MLSSIDVRALSLGMGAGCCELSGVRSEPGAGRPVAFVSPVGTLDAAAAGMGATFASSGRTGEPLTDWWQAPDACRRVHACALRAFWQPSPPGPAACPHGHTPHERAPAPLQGAHLRGT